MDPFLRLANRLERSLLKLVFVLAGVLLIIQVLLLDESTRWYLTYADPLEGAPHLVIPASGRETSLKLNLSLVGRQSAPDVEILVNGRGVGSFKGPSLPVRVSPGDIVAVRSRTGAEPVLVRVSGVTEGMVSPPVGREVAASRRLAVIGSVEWRSAR